MALRITFFGIILCFSSVLVAQLEDDFTDGDFTNNPVWSGDVSQFQILDERLVSNGPEGDGELYLSTPNLILDNVVWEFFVAMDFAPSGSNKARIYLTADQSDLESALNGYFIEIGQTGDDYVTLKRSDNGVATDLIVGSTAFEDQVRVKVVRNAAGDWQLLTDHTGGVNYTQEGTVNDNTHTSTSHFGIVVNHTSSRRSGFTFDDFKISQLQVDSVVVNTSTTLDIFLNQELDKSSVENPGNYSIPNLNITSAVQDANNSKKINLNLDPTSALTTGDYTLTVSSVLTGNEPAVIDFSYLELGLEAVLTISDTEIELTFNDELNEISASTVANYSIDNGIGVPSNAALSSANNQKVNLTLPNSLFEGTSFQLSISNLSNATGNSQFTGIRDFTFTIPLIVDTVEVVSENQILVRFNKSINESLAEIPANYTLNQSIGNPTNAELQADQKSVLLTTNTDLSENTYQLSIDNLEDLEGNMIDVSGDSYSFSYLPLKIDEVSQAGDLEIKVVFNQNVDQISAEEISHYLLSEIGSPASVTWSSDIPEEVLIAFSELYNNDYELSVTGVENDAHNSTIEATLKATIEKSTPYRFIIISEIMADPTPSQGLPEAEYVELFNRSDFTIDLEGFKLNDEVISTFQLAPDAYVLLTDDSNLSAFGLENSIGVGDFDALTNGGDFVVLEDQFGNRVDSLTYDSDWYQSDEKSDGGFALELIDPLKDCLDPGNWTASAASDGGTPGAQNSVFDDVDNTPPSIAKIEVQGDEIILINFSEALDSTTVQLADFEVPGNSVGSLEFVALNSFKILLGAALESEIFHELKVSNVADCRGNALSAQSLKFYHDTKPPTLEEVRLVSSSEIALLFSEPLQESRAEDEDHYVIAGNPTFRAILQDTANNRVQVRFDQDFTIGHSYELNLSGLQDTLGNVINDQSTSFQYLNDIDTAYVLSPNILALRFKELPSSPSATRLENYLLDDTRSNPIEVDKDNENTKLIHLAFAKNFDDNRELTLWVDNVRKANGELINTPAYRFEYDTRAANIESLMVKNDSQLVLTWNEPMNIQSASNSALYFLEDDEQPVDIHPLSALSFELTFEDTFEIELTKTLAVRNVLDRAGVEVTTTRRKNFVYDPRPPQLLDVVFIGDNQLKVKYSEKLSMLSATNSENYSLAGADPITQTIKGPDSVEVILTFPSIAESSGLTFTAANISDLVGNVNPGDTLLVNTQQPRLVNIEAANESILLAIYSHAMGTSAFSWSGYSETGTEIQSVSQVNNRTAQIQMASNMRDGDTLTIIPQNLMGQNGENLAPDTVHFIFDSYLTTSHIADRQTLVFNFDTEFESINKSDFTIAEHSITFATIDSEDPNIIRLTLSDTVPENRPFIVSWSGLTDRFGRKLPDYFAEFELDTERPQLSSLQSDFFGRLKLMFSEPMDEASVTSRNKYYIPGLKNPASCQLIGEGEVVLNYSDQLLIDSTYSLIIYPVADLSDNYSVIDTLSFSYHPPDLPDYGDLVFSEIMADPTPAIALPEVEYLELYNTTTQTFDLIGLELNGASLGQYLLQPDSYVLLVDQGDADLFDISNVHEINLPTLPNSGSSLSLRTIRGDLVDELTYDLSWYHDTQKDDGGYSLELIDPTGSCPPLVNWTSSESETGGTPGAKNSVYRTGQDNDMPKVAGWSAANELQILITFSESMDAASLEEMALTIEGAEQPTLSIKYPEINAITLQFNDALVAGQTYELSLSGATDCTGNPMQDTTLLVGIGKVPEPGDLIITEIMADPDPPVGLPNVEYVEIFNTTDLWLNLSSVRFRDNNSSRELPDVNLLGGNYAILCPQAQQDTFAIYGQSIGVSSWPSLTNAGERLSLFTTEVIDEVTYSDDWFQNQDHADGGYALELINPSSECPGSANWSGSVDESGGTPGRQNSIYSLNPDQEAPIILSLEALSKDSLKITFNEAMDASSLTNAVISGVVIERRTVAGALNEQLILNLSQPLAAGKVVTVEVSDARDCSGNEMIAQSFEIGFGDVPKFNEVLITEIMADPEPVVGLPNSEYLELYNASDRLISLSGLTLYDNTSETNLPAITLEPNAYLLIAPNATVGDFSVEEKAGISGWPSLNNGGEHLAIRYGDQLIFEISYTDEWHSNDEKGSGGFSLEMKDLTNPCGGRLNWASSEAIAGGTPGKVNSITQSVPDNFGPNLIEAYLKSTDSIVMVFDEVLLTDQIAGLMITPELSVGAVAFGESRSILIAKLEEVPEMNQPYSIQLESGVFDCNGNPIRDNAQNFVLHDEVAIGDVVLSELLFNPRSGGVDFIELYNKSSKYLQLQSWGLARRLEAQDVETVNERFTLEPSGYVALTEDTMALKNNYPAATNMMQTANLPTMSNDEGNVAILGPEGEVLDEFNYSEDYHVALLEDMDGVSLERIALDQATQDPNNWTSASSAVGFATPGYANSQSFNIPQTIGQVSVEPKVFVPGSTNPGFQSFTTINYQLDKSGQFANITVYNQLGQPVAELAKGTSLNTSGFIRWDGTSHSGNRVRMGYYVVLFEIYDGAGNQQVLKETVVVGR